MTSTYKFERVLNPNPAALNEWHHAYFALHNVVQRFQWIMPGKYLMGSPTTEKEREAKVHAHGFPHGYETLHEVNLSKGFWLAITPCTQQLWQAVMNTNPSEFKDNQYNPVENITWHQTIEFINKLNNLIPNLKARLPSEAEWEYACRADSTTPFSFGDTITTSEANYDGDYPYGYAPKGLNRKKTTPVKSLACNQWGLYDMHGNVWEWCADSWQAKLDAKPLMDPLIQQADHTARVVRGGSWFDNAKHCRSATRAGWPANQALARIGFRLAADGS